MTLLDLLQVFEKSYKPSLPTYAAQWNTACYMPRGFKPFFAELGANAHGDSELCLH